MSDRPEYFDRVVGTFEGHYVEYQKKYEVEPRESDKVLLGLVAEAIGASPGGSRPADVLDIGCSTGNFLRMLKREHPDANLVGGDLAEEALEEARRAPDLDGIGFEVMDVTKLGAEAAYDLIVVNAVFCVMPHDAVEAAVHSIASALRPGGHLVLFEWLHPFHHDIVISEQSDPTPEATLYFRSIPRFRRWMDAAGFETQDYRTFEIPIDLPRRAEPNGDVWADLETWTIPTADGKRILMRGPISQPWCHLIARRAG